MTKGTLFSLLLSHNKSQRTIVRHNLNHFSGKHDTSFLTFSGYKYVNWNGSFLGQCRLDKLDMLSN